MDIGIGLPAAVPGTNGPTIIEWAESAADVGFSSVGVLDRILYDSYDPIAVLGAACAVADVRLLGAVLLVPFRGSGAVLAKQLASVDRLSFGRLTVAVVAGTTRTTTSILKPIPSGAAPIQTRCSRRCT